MKSDQHAKQFCKIVEGLARRQDRHRVFLDWLTMASASLLARSSPWHREEAEKAYMEAVARWQPDEVAEMTQLLGIVTLALEDEFQDFLGHCYMSMEMGNKHQGQFFTPYSLSRTLAELTIGDLDQSKDFWTLQEPACGSGGMVIAAMEAFRARGVNYQTQTYTLAVDVSEMAARMAYIQLSVLGIPAKVVLGNTLSLETRAVWPTLFYGRVCHKLPRPGRTPWTTPQADVEAAAAAALEGPPALELTIRNAVRDEIPDPPPPGRVMPEMPQQLTLF